MDQVISGVRVVMLVLFFVAGLGVGYLMHPPAPPVVPCPPCPEPPKVECPKCPEPPAKPTPTYRVIPPRTFDR